MQLYYLSYKLQSQADSLEHCQIKEKDGINGVENKTIKLNTYLSAMSAKYQVFS